VGSSAFVVSRSATTADLRLAPAACLGATGRGKDLHLVLLLNQTQHIPSLVHLQFHLRGHIRRTSSGPEDPQRGAGHAPPSQQTVRQKCVLERGRSLVVCGQTRKDGSVSGGRRPLDHQEESTERVCNPKSDSKRTGHHTGQKKGTRTPQVISRVSLNWLHRTTRPGSKGVCSFLRDTASETTASRNSQEPPHPVQGQRGPCSHDRPEGLRRNIPTPAETRTKPLPVVTGVTKGLAEFGLARRSYPPQHYPSCF